MRALVAEDNMAVARMLRNTSATLVARGPGHRRVTDHTDAPQEEHGHTSRGLGPGRVRVPSRPARVRPPIKTPEPGDVATGIPQEIAGLLRAQGLSPGHRPS